LFCHVFCFDVRRSWSRPRAQHFRTGQKDESLHHLIDELDALGKSREMGGGADKPFCRSNDEAEQTLNQLLACMDGLNNSRRICVLAATDRREVLDPALVRPGRFDRIVKLELPNAAGRERILRVHCAKLPNFVEGSGVDPKRPNALGQGRAIVLSAVAAATDGLCGAELEFCTGCTKL
jgi:ATP-dependent Zn protease